LDDDDDEFIATCCAALLPLNVSSAGRSVHTSLGARSIIVTAVVVVSLNAGQQRCLSGRSPSDADPVSSCL